MEKANGRQICLDRTGRLAGVLQVQHIAYQMLATDVLQLLQMVLCSEVGAEPFARLVAARLGTKAALTVVPRQLVKLCDRGEEYPFALNSSHRCRSP